MIKSFMEISIIAFLITSFLFLSDSIAGNVRSLYTNDQKMEKIYLSMGKSTILRFTFENPKKVVLGNQNYYKLEFIGSDVTIQPQGQVSTNLFVYTENRVYGFLLTPSHGGNYDDLVKVRWRAKSSVKIRKTRKKRKNKQTEIKFGKIKSLTLGTKLKVNIVKITLRNIDKGIYFIDLKIENLTKERLKTKNLRLFVSRNKKELLKQQLVFEKEVLNGEERIKARLILKLKNKKGMSLEGAYQEKLKTIKNKIIIRRKYL